MWKKIIIIHSQVNFHHKPVFALIVSKMIVDLINIIQFLILQDNSYSIYYYSSIFFYSEKFSELLKYAWLRKTFHESLLCWLNYGFLRFRDAKFLLHLSTHPNTSPADARSTLRTSSFAFVITSTESQSFTCCRSDSFDCMTSLPTARTSWACFVTWAWSLRLINVNNSAFR